MTTGETCYLLILAAATISFIRARQILFIQEADFIHSFMEADFISTGFPI